MNKKASLSLSITAIVVIVIAFVVLGLGLSLTRTIFKGAQDKLPEAFAVTQLEAEPTSENPITVAQTVEIDRSKSKTMSIGYYNRRQLTAERAKFTITECLNNEGTDVTELTEPKNPPVVASPSEEVKGSDALGYSIILNEQGLSEGTYICTMAVCDASACDITGTPTIYESKQFFLQVVA